MDNKRAGFILIGIAALAIASLVVFQIQVNQLVDSLMIMSGGICITETGECLHEQNRVPMYLGIAGIVALLSLALYLIFFDRSQKLFEKNQERIVKTLEEGKKEIDLDEKFKYLLQGLDEDEKKVIKAVKEQDGITQATLRIRTDMSKTKLSLVLSALEKKDLIKKIPDKKTNKIHLKKAI